MGGGKGQGQGLHRMVYERKKGNGELQRKGVQLPDSLVDEAVSESAGPGPATPPVSSSTTAD